MRKRQRSRRKLPRHRHLHQLPAQKLDQATVDLLQARRPLQIPFRKSRPRMHQVGRTQAVPSHQPVRKKGLLAGCRILCREFSAQIIEDDEDIGSDGETSGRPSGGSSAIRSNFVLHSGAAACFSDDQDTSGPSHGPLFTWIRPHCCAFPAKGRH